MNNRIALIVSTYNQPQHLERCLLALQFQTLPSFEIIIADDGSGEETRKVIEAARQQLTHRLHHVWQTDEGFRKTRILNQAMLATEAEYLVFIDGDCVAHPDFLVEHDKAAQPGSYLNGAMIRLEEDQSDCINADNIRSAEVFKSSWLTRAGKWNRRYLKLSLPYSWRCWLNKTSKTKLYWLGANSSCYRTDALAVNGFDNRFTYGFEDGDFGNRLENHGLEAKTVRWTANLLHLFHGRPYTNPEDMKKNLAMMTTREAGGKVRTEDGLQEIAAELNNPD